MTILKHTPGPWAVGNIKQSNRPDANYPVEAYYDADGERFLGTVAEIPTWSFDGVTDAKREEHIANARLIAAAPDLLTALQNLMAVTDEMHPRWQEARAAIAAAEGRAE